VDSAADDDHFDPYEVITLAPLMGQRMPIPVDVHCPDEGRVRWADVGPCNSSSR
jgi:hypothetical protein